MRLSPKRWALLLAVLIAAFRTGFAAESLDLDWPRAEAHATEENARLAARPQGRGRALVVICTLYYTPRESGFTAERGFDITAETAPGLGGRRYGRDFLRAVKTEGFGRLRDAINGAAYLHYDGDGHYGFARRPAGRNGVALVARRSCAVRGGESSLPVGTAWLIDAAALREVFSPTIRWQVADSGGGLHPWQVDLYWGEDDPRGPGADLARPRGADFQWTFGTARRVDN